jgi:hypothetical protein
MSYDPHFGIGDLVTAGEDSDSEEEESEAEEAEVVLGVGAGVGASSFAIAADPAFPVPPHLTRDPVLYKKDTALQEKWSA